MIFILEERIFLILCRENVQVGALIMEDIYGVNIGSFVRHSLRGNAKGYGFDCSVIWPGVPNRVDE
jgi:hypothetical protein